MVSKMKRFVQKLYVVLQILSMFSSLTFTVLQAKADTKSQTKKYVIGAHQGGFFAAFLAVLNHLAYCKQTNRTPVVYWDNRSWYYRKGGFNGSHNVWEYYFQPVSKLQYEPKKDKLNSSYGGHSNKFHYTALDETTRHNAHDLIAKYIRIKPVVQKKIDDFYQKRMMGKHTIGIHLRGTDKFREMAPVALEKIIAAALEHVNGDTQFFVASDEQQLLEQAVKLLEGHNVISYDCYRSATSQPLHTRNSPSYAGHITGSSKPSYAQLGQDVLVEVSLFARCDILVHTRSNVSAAAFYYNPRLKSVVVSE